MKKSLSDSVPKTYDMTNRQSKYNKFLSLRLTEEQNHKVRRIAGKLGLDVQKTLRLMVEKFEE